MPGIADPLRQHDANIEAYRRAWLISRRLGDAWAWALLGADERVIEPLTHNLSTGQTSSGHSLQGILLVAESMATAGIGFPIVHDMTDCLRVGDITFIGADGMTTTVEVKTHTEDETDEAAPMLGIMKSSQM